MTKPGKIMLPDNKEEPENTTEDSNGAVVKGSREWSKILKWASCRKYVTKNDLAKRSGRHPASCQRMLKEVSLSAGYIIRESTGGKFQVAKAAHFRTSDITDELDKGALELFVELDKKAKYALHQIMTNDSQHWTSGEQIKFLGDLLQITKCFVSG